MCHYPTTVRVSNASLFFLSLLSPNLLLCCLTHTFNWPWANPPSSPFCMSPPEFRGILPLSPLVTSCFSLVSPAPLPHSCQKSTYRTYWLYHTQILHCQRLPSASLVEFKFCNSEISSVQVNLNKYMPPLYRIIWRIDFIVRHQSDD